AYDAFLGKEIDLTLGDVTHTSPGKANVEAQADMDIKFGYCTEFIIMLSRNFNIKNEMDFKEYLESIGDSIVVVADDDVVKVHVHTNDPGLAIQKALKYGALSNLKIDNMRLEHQEKLFKAGQALQEENSAHEEPMPHKEVGFIAVSVGEGINEIFKGLGIDYIIEGGQTMNPSTEDMLNAIEKVNADTVFILPNNKNIILAANQAQMMVEDKKIVVVPTKTVPQGITAVINYVPDMTAEENAKTMEQEIGNVKTGQVTYAVRDTVIDDKEIKQGDYMGIGDAGILSVGGDVADVTYHMVEEMMNDDLELISIYYGEEVAEEAAESLKARIEEAFPSCDIELQYGGHDTYTHLRAHETLMKR
ncbi:MAG: DAK2 domain-containing protein, partial [Lachnospiraceae bacterium]|nr:DAK2 domain-containing protein [Lachnospiraceae bacterium]